MKLYFSDNDPTAAAWLRQLFPAATVDERRITDVIPTDVAGYRRCHFFGGIGGWEYALALAGWPESRPAFVRAFLDVTGACAVVTIFHLKRQRKPMKPPYRPDTAPAWLGRAIACVSTMPAADDDGESVIKPPAQDAANIFLRACAAQAIEPAYVSPIADGGIAIGFHRRNSREGSIECDNDGKIFSITFDRYGSLKIREAKSDPGSLFDAIYEIKALIER